MKKSRNELIKILETTPANLARLTSKVTDAQLDFRSGPEDWTAREVLAHLVDDEMYVMRLRLERIIKEDLPDLTPHDEKKWYANRNTNRDNLDQLLEDFAIQRAASLNIFQILRESDWQREGFQPEYGRFRAEKWLENWADHDTNHLKQIEKTLGS